VTALVISNNRKFLVSGGMDGEVRVWEIRTREMVVKLKQHTSEVTSLKLLPDDSGIFSSSRDRTILQWDLRAETRLHCMNQRMGGINGIALLDRDRLVSVGQEKSISSWISGEEKPICSIQLSDEQHAIAVWCPPNVPPAAVMSQTIIATAGSGDYKVRLWKFEPGKEGVPMLMGEGIGHSSTVRSLQFSPDGKQLVTVGDDSSVLVWNIYFDEIIPSTGQ